MGEKTRGNYPVNVCISDCINRTECESCYMKSKYKAPNEEVLKVQKDVIKK